MKYMERAEQNLAAKLSSNLIIRINYVSALVASKIDNE